MLNYADAGLDIDPSDIELLQFKGAAFFKMQKFTEAINEYQKIIAVDPANKHANTDLAELYLISNQPEKYADFIKNKNSFI